MRSHALATLILGLGLSGCWSEAPPGDSAATAGQAGGPPAGGQEPSPPGPPEPPPPSPPPDVPAYSSAVDHAFLGLVPGLVRVYEGHDDGRFRRDRVEVLQEPETVAGVACTAVRQEVFLDGVLAEVTTEWYASDEAGDVWMFGEASVEIEDFLPVPTEDSWQAGVDGAVPWMVLGAEVEVGQVYAGSHPGGREEVTVLALEQSAVVPAGTFDGCLVVVETNPEDEPVDVEDADRIIYAPAVGMVSEDSPGGRIELVSFGPR